MVIGELGNSDKKNSSKGQFINILYKFGIKYCSWMNIYRLDTSVLIEKFLLISKWPIN